MNLLELFESVDDTEDLADIEAGVSVKHLGCAAESMARRVSEADIANFYGKLFHGQAPVAVVTLDDRHVEEAIRLRLLDTANDYVILAYRNLQAQALIKIPADRYDGLAILRLVADA